MVINSVYTKHTKGVKFLEAFKIAFSSQSREAGKRHREPRKKIEMNDEELKESFNSNETIGFDMEVETPTFVRKKKNGGAGGMASKSLMS